MSNFENQLLEGLVEFKLNEDIMDFFKTRSKSERVNNANTPHEIESLYRSFRNNNTDVHLKTLAAKTPEHIFHKLASSPNVGDRVNAALHGTHGVRARLLNDVNPNVRAALAKSTTFHQHLVSDDAPMVRHVVASHATHANVLHKLVADIDPRVAIAAAARTEHSKELSPDLKRNILGHYARRHPSNHSSYMLMKQTLEPK